MSYPRQPEPYPQHQPRQQFQPYQPQQPFAQPYGAPGQLPAGAGGIAVTTRYFPLGFMLALVKPKILIDGYQTPPAGWGRTVLPTQPGRHHVHVHVPYFLPSKIGPADAVVDVHPGHVVELEYKTPAWTYSAGSLGPPPQSYKGLGIAVAVMVVPFALTILLIIMVVLLGR